MGFSPKIKQDAMIASARHCCVCHEYKGVNIEVHHIEPESEGGPNTYANAIPLCFDCHANAGHFNNQHPRGTKFSRPELKKARNVWYENVRKNGIPQKLIISEHIHTSYYVLHSLEVLEAVISNNDFKSFNQKGGQIYLQGNHISAEWKKLLKYHLADYKSNTEQTLIIEVRQFPSIEEYAKTYKNVELIDKSDSEYPYYDARRIMEWGDLIDLLTPNSFLGQLIHSGIEANNFCASLLRENGETCGGAMPSGYTEYLQIAPISFVFLGITNTAKREQIKLNYLVSEDERIQLPNFNIPPHSMVLIPVSTTINMSSIHQYGDCLYHIDGDRGQDLSRVVGANAFNDSELLYFNNRINPKTIIYNNNSGEYAVDLHQFDYDNLYSIDSYWQCGSCPHLFYINKDGRQKYSRELLISFSNRKGVEYIQVPSNVHKIAIRELEDEITFIDRIYINGVPVITNKQLAKNQSIEIKVDPLDKIIVEGGYFPIKIAERRLNDMWYRNNFIRKSNSEFNSVISQP